MPRGFTCWPSCVARAALPDPPAVVVQPALLAPACARRPPPSVLADVADVEVVREPVEREAPRVAQPVAGDLPARAALVDVQAQQLAEADAQVLRAVARVAARAAVAHPDVEPAVGPELELAAVVVVVRLLDEQQPPAPSSAAPTVPFERNSTTRVSPFGRCSRRRSGGSARSPDGTRPRAGPARRRSGRGCGCRGTAARAACRSRARGSRPAARPRRASPARCAARSRRPASRSRARTGAGSAGRRGRAALAARRSRAARPPRARAGPRATRITS